MPATLVWFRHDLRLDDNPALSAAIGRDQPILPVFIWAPEEEAPWQPGSASKWWLHHSLKSLQDGLAQRGSQLILRAGATTEVLAELIDQHDIDAVYWNRLYEPAIIARDKTLKSQLSERSIDAKSFNGALLIEPWDVETQQGNPYQVFTPYWKKISSQINVPAAERAPIKLPGVPEKVQGEPLDSLELLPQLNWADEFHERWTPGTKGARKELDRFLDSALPSYDAGRNRPDQVGTSRMSPYLHFGEISVREIWRKISDEISGDKSARESGETYLKELGWREFTHHLLYHFPKTTERPLREKFADFPWEKDGKALQKWQQGQTGYPIVDAGMRELWRTGWMHNRVRMIVASFLTKDLRINWKQGAEWFWDTLVDADLANNTLGWQWTAGCGADAAPYFRVFNPTSQAKKYDPDGDYIREFVPELKSLSGKPLYEPWELSKDERAEAGIELGADYPHPIVDHSEARQIALKAYDSIK